MSAQAVQSISITENAANHIRELLAEKGKPDAVFRIRIIAGGCSGLQYKMDVVDSAKPEDKILEAHGVKVAIDPKTFIFLNGSNIDYKDELITKGFKITNPKAKAKCSCGHSFSI